MCRSCETDQEEKDADREDGRSRISEGVLSKGEEGKGREGCAGRERLDKGEHGKAEGWIRDSISES